MSDGLGIWLRRTRETQQLTLSDVEKALRIRRRYLEALEIGDYTALPGEIQARGFLRNYARYLGLPIEEVLSRYDAEVQGKPLQPRAYAPAPDSKARGLERPSVFEPPPSDQEEIASVRRGVPQRLLLILFVALLFFAILAIGSFVWLQMSSPQQDDTPVTQSLTTVTLEASASELEAPEAEPAFVPAVDGRVNLRLVPNQNAWVSLSADENIVFQGVAEPGQVLEAAATEMCIVATGNGGAFQLYVNGTDWGALGEQGAIVRRAWSPSGEVVLEEQ